MERAEVVVVPVALVAAPGDQLRLMAYRPGGEFLRAPVRPGGAVASALSLMRSSDAADVFTGEADERLEAVAFLAKGPRVTLLYTVVAPLLDANGGGGHLGDPHEDWVLLTPWAGDGAATPAEKLPAEHLLVRNYWRRQLEETSAVLDFLPGYFMTSQARAAYSSLWGWKQHVGAFHRWLHDRSEPKTPIVQAVDEDIVRDAAGEAFTRALRSSDLGPQIEWGDVANRSASAATALLGTGVGLSAAMVAGTAFGVLPAAIAAGALTGSRVAFQQRTGRGKKPLWFSRTLPERILMDDPYAPRPRWLPSGSRPGPFH